MHFLIGCLLLLLLSAFCAVCLRRFAGEQDAWLLALASLGLAGILLVLGGAMLLPWMAPTSALCLLGVASLLGSLLLGRGRQWAPLQPRQDALWLSLAALPGMLLCGFFALFIMSVSFGVDDGFFVHTSNMGMILAGKYPPTSFLGEPWQGHYGKDMLTALLSLAFGSHFLEAEWVSTTAIQVLHFLFLVHWLRVEGGKPAHGLLGAYFAFFASAFGDHLGLVDTIANNNAVAYQTITLCSYLLLRWWRRGDWRTAVLAGIVLGADALIYELHFGLLGLSLFSFTVLSKQRYKGFLILVTSAVLLASVEGGAITQIAHKALFGRAQHQQNTKKAWQSQDVELKFPKDQIFYLRRDNLRPSRFFETRLRPDSVSFEASRELAPLLSRPILACFWYPVWLAPFVLIALIAQRNVLGGWFFAMGTYSVLTPCLVSFGYFEGETARWLFGTSFGLSTAFALALAQACQAARPRRYLAYLVLAWTILFNYPVIPMEIAEMRAALDQPGNALKDGSPGVVPNGGLLPRPRLSLAHHYGFDDDDWRITEALRAVAQADSDFLGSRYLVNYADEAVAQGVEVASGGQLNIMGLQTGLSGRLPAGLAGAPENLWCAPLFSQKLEARAFWADPRLWRLQDLGVRWLLIDESRLAPSSMRAVAEIPGLREVFRSGSESLWQLPPPPAARSQPHTPVELRPLANGVADAPLRPRQPYLLKASASSPGGAVGLEFRYLVASTGEPANPDDPLRDRLDLPPGEGSVELHLIGPYFAGRYKLQWRASGQSEWKPLERLNFVEAPPAPKRPSPSPEPGRVPGESSRGAPSSRTTP
jgi:hypothetical protein